MANFVTTLPKITSSVDYIFWEIYIKSILALITYSEAVFTDKDMLNTLALSQITNMYKITRRNFLCF